MSVQIIERTEWDERLSEQYQQSLLQLSVAFSLFGLVAVVKSAVFYFFVGNLFEISRLFTFSTHNAGQVFLHYFFLPEYFSFLSQTVYTVQDYCQLALACTLITGVIAVFALFERRFFGNHLKESSTDELVHLFTLEVGLVRSVDEALKLLEVFRLICGGEDPVFNYSLVFDTAFIRKERESRERGRAGEDAPSETPSASPETAPASDEPRTPASALTPLTRHAHLAYIEQMERRGRPQRGSKPSPPARSDTQNAEELELINAGFEGDAQEALQHSIHGHFLGKMFVTFKDYASVKELLVLHSTDKLEQAAQDLLDGKLDCEELQEVQEELLREAVDPERGYLSAVRLSPSHHLHDFIWESARAGKAVSKLKYAFLFCLIGLCFAALVVLVQYYDVYIFFQLVIHPEKATLIWGYRFTPEMVVFKLCLIVIPEICQIILDIFLNELQQRYYSSASNARFYVKLGAEVLLVFVASFYGYYIAVVLIRQSLQQELLFNAFYQTTLEWNIKALLLLGKAVLKYAIDFARKLLARLKARRTGNALDYTFDNAISSSMVIMIFLHAGFYLNGLSPFALLVLSACLFLNWAVDRLFKADKEVIRNYISHQNISMLIVFSGIVFAAGGVFALHMQFYFTPAVFFAETGTVVFPMFFVFSACALAVMIPLLTHMASHRAVGMRLLEFLVHKSPVQELEVAPKKDFRSANPFYTDVVELSPHARKLIL